MCGNDGLLPTQQAVNPLYALRMETMPRYNPLATDVMGSAYHGIGGYTPHTSAEPELHLAHHDLLEGVRGHHSLAFQQEGYPRREKPEMMYQRDDLAVLDHAYASAAMQTTGYMGAWRQMQFNAGSN